MKTLVWALTGLVATVWTGAVALAVQLTEWPAPAWLTLWIDPAAVQALQSAWLTAWDWMARNAPSFNGALDWLPPMMWVVWGVVVLCMVALAGLLHWLIGRTTAQPGIRQPAGH